MQDRHPFMRALSVSLPLLLLVAGGLFFGLSASSRFPNGELRVMPSPVTEAEGFSHVSLEPITSFRLPDSVLNFNDEQDVLYASITKGGLVTLDITNLEAPVVVDHITLDPPSDPRHVNQYVLNAFPVGDRLVVLDRVRGLVVYDAADPLHPEYLWSRLLPGSPGDQAIDLEHVGENLYLACGGAGLVQVSANLTPDSELNYVLNRFDHTTNLTFIQPDWLLASDGRNGGLQIVGQAGMEEPRPLGNITTWPLYMENIVTRGHHVFASTRGDNVMVVFNLENPSSPYVSNFFRQQALRIRTIAGWKDRYILLSNDFGFLEIFDARDPESPRLVSLIPVKGKISAMFTRDDILYTGFWEEKRVGVFRLIEDATLVEASAIPS